MTGRERHAVPRCNRRVDYVLTDLAHAAIGPATGAELAEPEAVPYALTAAGRAALATSPANDLDHEPRHGCEGRDCQCAAGRWSRVRPR